MLTMEDFGVTKKATVRPDISPVVRNAPKSIMREGAQVPKTIHIDDLPWAFDEEVDAKPDSTPFFVY